MLLALAKAGGSRPTAEISLDNIQVLNFQFLFFDIIYIIK